MNFSIAKKCCLLLTIICPTVFADAPSWQIVPDKSRISFTATQNNAPIKGEFKKFNGDIHFDPSKLNESHIKMSVDMNSVAGAFEELSSMLRTLDWFDTAKYPAGTFNSTEITKVDDKNFKIKGEMNVRDKKEPVTFDVILDENTPTQMRLHGTTNIKRTAFGVGQGDWADTTDVKDDVKVDFNLELKK